MSASRENTLRTGFTLIELMIVVAIIALLIAILLPSLARAREQAMAVACAANLSSIHKGMFYYSEDTGNGNGYLPQVAWRIESEGGLCHDQTTPRPGGTFHDPRQARETSTIFVAESV